MTIQIPERTPTPRSSRARIYSGQSRLRFLPFPRKTPHVHINTPTFIRPTPCPRVPPVRRRHTLVHGVTSQHRPGFRHESRGIPWCGYRRSNAATSRHRHFNCPWRLNTIVDTKHYVSHCIDIFICILFQPDRFIKNSFVYCFSFLLKMFFREKK